MKEKSLGARTFSCIERKEEFSLEDEDKKEKEKSVT